MKKVVCLSIVIVIIFILCSCTKDVTSVFFRDKDNDLADARMEQLFNAIKEQDGDAIKNIFSKKVLAETTDIDDSVDNLISFVQGEVISWSRDESPIVFDRVEDGCKTKQLVTWYKLNTDKRDYLIFIVDYPIDTIDSENVGLYSLRIINAEDENKLVGTWEDWVIPGIFILDNNSK